MAMVSKAEILAPRRAAAARGIARAAHGDEKPKQSGGNEDSNRRSAGIGGDRYNQRPNAPGNAPKGYNRVSNAPGPGAGDTYNVRSNEPAPPRRAANDNERSNPPQTVSPNESTDNQTPAKSGRPSFKPNPRPQAGADRIMAASDNRPEPQPAWLGQDLGNLPQGDRWARARASAKARMR